MGNVFKVLLAGLFLVGAGLGIYYWQAALIEKSTDSVAEHIATGEGKKLSKYDRMDLAMQQEIEMTKDPALGYVPRERLITAIQQAERTANSRAAIPGVEWIERGPNNVGGRTRAVIFDPNDPSNKKVFAGSVSGGLWVCNDITQPNPGWSPVNDLFANLAVSTIAFDPSNTTTMYFGTGEGYLNADAVLGNGIWKSTDGGNTWSQLNSTTSSSFNAIQKIVVTSNGTVLAATRAAGLLRSTNGGTSWSAVLSTSTGAANNRCADIERAANGDLYSSIGIFTSDGIYKSTDDGATWTKLTGGGLPTSDFHRIELACAPSDANTVLAIMRDATPSGSNDCLGLYLTTDGGSTWSTLTMPIYNQDGASDFTRGQAWYDLIGAFDPNDANRIYVGGIDIHLSEDQGSTWDNVGDWRGTGFQYVHADQHAIYFLPGSSSKMLLGTDGGVYYSSNADASNPTIESRNLGYNTVQFYSGDLAPMANNSFFIAGAQDNGSHLIKGAGVRSSVEVTGGDGAYTHIDQDEAQYIITSYVYNNYRVSMDSGKSFTYVNYSDDGRFINPTDYDDSADKLYCAENLATYLRWDNPQSGGSSFTSVPADWAGRVSAVTVDDQNANTVWFGTGAGEVYKVTNAHATPSFTDYSSGLPGNYVSSITIDPNDGNHLLVTFSNYGVTSVYESTNGGSSWTAVEGNLPDMPVRSALFNPNNGDQALIATEAGVWSTDNLNGSSTVWAATNTGLATVKVNQLKYRDSDGLVLAITHGRGMYTSDVFTTLNADFSVANRAVYIGQPVQFYDNSYQANTYSWNFGDGNSSSQQNPTHTYTTAGVYDVTLSINSGAATETKTSYITVLPNRTVPYRAHFGGNLEVNEADFAPNNIAGTPFERGSSAITDKNGTASGSFAWVTGLTAATYENYSTSYLLTPNFDFSAAGNYTLSFEANFDFFSNLTFTSDGFIIEYTLDRGENWFLIGDYPAFYNNANDVESTAFPFEIPHMIGNTTGYQNFSLDVSTLAGESAVGFRFVFKSDYGNNDEGLALDDITISGPSTGEAGVVMISQYQDGTNKGIELWNISDQAIDLSKTPIQLYRYTNGSSTPTLEVELSSGTLAAGDVAVVGNSSLQTYMATYHATVPFTLHTFGYDGDDAIEVVWDGYRNDVLGTIGVDPGSGWTANGVSTNNQHIELIPNLFAADTNGWSDPSVRFRQRATGTTWSAFGLPPASVYTQSAWTYSTPDASSDSINFHLLDGVYSRSGNTAMMDLYVSSPASFTLTSGTITIAGDFINQSTPVVIEENAALLMEDANATVTGSITAKRTGTPYSNIFNYWSTPVSSITYNAVWNNFSGFNATDLYLYDGNSQDWTTPTTGATIPLGTGVAMTGLINGGSNQRSFTGTPNNGDIDVTVYNTGGAGNDDDYNLIGNPYPSAVDAVAFLNDPANSELVGSIWYWDRDLTGTHEIADYAQWTLTGGLCPSGCRGASGSLVPDQYIPAMQGFMTEADNAGDGTVTFRNSHRVAGNNSKFFKSAPTDRIWLSASHESGPSNGILIGFTADATDGYDRMYDGRKLSGNADISFYTLLDDAPYAIQGRNSQMNTHIIPLGLRAGRAGQYTLQIDTMDNISPLTTIHIEHIPTGARYDLRQSPFTFQVDDAGSVVTDYQLIINGNSTSIAKGELPAIQWMRNQQSMVVWLSGTAPIAALAVYDVQGRIVYKQNSPGLVRATIPMAQHASGIYFIHIQTDGQVITRKVFY